MTSISNIHKARRHTLHFLNKAKENCPVYLSTTIDMSGIISHRREHQNADLKLSYIAYFISAIAKVLPSFPEANSAVKGSWFPSLALYNSIDAKFTLDKTIDGQRAVISALIENADQLSYEDIQGQINYYRDKDFNGIEQFKGLRTLQGLPMVAGRIIYNTLFDNLVKRKRLQGSFTVSSLGHKPIKNFFPMSSSTLAFGIGSIADHAVKDGHEMTWRPMTELNMVFDHRAIDGALAADLLTQIKHDLESVN